MYALEDCGSSYDAPPSICRHVTSALFPCHSKIYHLLCTTGLFKNVVAQFIGQFVLDESGNYKNLEVKYEDNP